MLSRCEKKADTLETLTFRKEAEDDGGLKTTWVRAKIFFLTILGWGES